MSRSDFNRANPMTVPTVLQKLKAGNLFLGQMVQSKRKLNPSALGVNAYNVATLHALQLPAFSRAASVIRATVRAGGVTGELAPQAFGATPATGQIAVAPNGDIVVLAADAITDLDVTYVPERGDVIEVVFPVVAGVMTLPTTGWAARGVVALLEAEALAATVTGKKIILVPGTAPATTQARLSVAKNTVLFNSATDAVTRARVKLLIGQADDLQVVLDETDDTL